MRKRVKVRESQSIYNAYLGFSLSTPLHLPVNTQYGVVLVPHSIYTTNSKSLNDICLSTPLHSPVNTQYGVVLVPHSIYTTNSKSLNDICLSTPLHSPVNTQYGVVLVPHSIYTTNSKSLNDICLSTPLHSPVNTQYGVVLDAGSSHTEMFVYKWPATVRYADTAVVEQIGHCVTNGNTAYRIFRCISRTGV